jgi:chromosomal replication initiator protein
MTFTPEVWDGVLRRLRSQMPPFAYEAWLAPLGTERSESGLALLCPSSFHRDRIHHHYLADIRRSLAEELGAELPVEVVVRAGDRAAKSPHCKASGSVAGASGTTQPAPSQPVASAEAKPAAPVPARARRALPVASPSQVDAGAADPRDERPRPRRHQASPAAARRPAAGPPSHTESPSSRALLQYTFDNFVVGPCNALAREASLAIAQARQQGLDQLYLCSQPGMGKTHLSRAVASEAARLSSQPSQDVRYVSAERFTNEFLSALRTRKTSEFKRHYRGRRQLLVVEDIQFLESKTATQLEFFHTVQHVLDAGGKVVLTGDRMPHEMGELGERVRAQLGGGFVAEIEPPDARVRRTILRSKAASGGVHLPGECLDLLVETMRGSVRDLESTLIQLVTTASLMKRSIDMELTEAVIERKTGDGVRPTRLTVSTVVDVVAGFFKTSPAQMAGRSRKNEVLIPRQLAMYLCRRYTDASVTEIGQALGRDHPAVRNAITKIERQMLERPRLRYQVEALGERLDQMVSGQDGPQV